MTIYTNRTTERNIRTKTLKAVFNDTLTLNESISVLTNRTYNQNKNTSQLFDEIKFRTYSVDVRSNS